MGKKNILIIDDESDFTQFVKAALETTDQYEVRMVNSGKEGLQAAMRFKPDLILLDIIMPDLEGSYVAEELKNNPQTADIPIVFVTATIAKHETRDEETTIGGRVFLAKPVKISELISCLKRHLP